MAATSSPNLLQLWSQRFKQFNAGSLTVQQFCVSARCSVASFYYWKKKVERLPQSSDLPLGQDRTGQSYAAASKGSARLVRSSVLENSRAASRVSSAQDAGRVSAFVPVVVRGAGELGTRPICVRLHDGTKVMIPVDALEALQVVLQHASRVAS